MRRVLSVTLYTMITKRVGEKTEEEVAVSNAIFPLIQKYFLSSCPLFVKQDGKKTLITEEDGES